MLTQVHCHQHAVLGWDADEKLLTAADAQAEHLETGCCSLAGNFGFQVCHGEVSEACAKHALLPRLREAAPGAVVPADGFSCCTQIHELDSGGREPCTSPSCLPRRAASTTTIRTNRRPAARLRHPGQPGPPPWPEPPPPWQAPRR